MISMKTLMLNAIDQTAPCDHKKPRYITKCKDCVANTLDGLCRWYYAAELRNHIYNETIHYRDEAGIYNRILNEDYWLGFQTAINMIDPLGTEFITIMHDNNLTGEIK